MRALCQFRDCTHAYAPTVKGFRRPEKKKKKKKKKKITMSAGNKKTRILNSVGATFGCCGRLCRRPTLSAVFQPQPRQCDPLPRRPRRRRCPSSRSWGNTTTTFSSAFDTPTRCCSSDAGSDWRNLKIGGESVAVEKDSDDPYNDFRQSMLQMILENEIYSKEDLREMLNCFLRLNSPYYHGIIVRAFTGIWNGAAAQTGCGYPNPNMLWPSRDF